MAILSTQQAAEKLTKKSPQAEKELPAAVKHDERCFFHTEPADEKDLRYLSTFRAFVQRILNKDKYQVFEHLLRTPLPTVEITEGILSELDKVFWASDGHIKITSQGGDVETDFA